LLDELLVGALQLNQRLLHLRRPFPFDLAVLFLFIAIFEDLVAFHLERFGGVAGLAADLLEHLRVEHSAPRNTDLVSIEGALGGGLVEGAAEVRVLAQERRRVLLGVFDLNIEDPLDILVVLFGLGDGALVGLGVVVLIAEARVPILDFTDILPFLPFLLLQLVFANEGVGPGGSLGGVPAAEGGWCLQVEFLADAEDLVLQLQLLLPFCGGLLQHLLDLVVVILGVMKIEDSRARLVEIGDGIGIVGRLRGHTDGRLAPFLPFLLLRTHLGTCRELPIGGGLGDFEQVPLLPHLLGALSLLVQ